MSIVFPAIAFTVLGLCMASPLIFSVMAKSRDSELRWRLIGLFILRSYSLSIIVLILMGALSIFIENTVNAYIEDYITHKAECSSIILLLDEHYQEWWKIMWVLAVVPISLSQQHITKRSKSTAKAAL